MGTQKDPKAKKPTRSSARLSAHTQSREPKSNLRPTKSPHFPPPASIIEARPPREKWQPWEKKSLISLRKEGKSLGEISQQLPGRSNGACSKQYEEMLKARKQASTSQQKDSLADIHEFRRPWKKWEDQLVSTNRIAGKSYDEISRLLRTRTADAVGTQWKNCIRPHLKDLFFAHKSRWSEREDQLLVSLHSAGESFAEIAQKIPNRSKVSCKKHWHGLKICGPGLPKRWTILEEKTLVSLFNTLGPRWYEIAKNLPGRTEKACEKHYSKPSCRGKIGASGPLREDWISHWDSAPNCEEIEMDAIEHEFAVHDENGDEGLDVEESASAPVRAAPTLKRDQHSRSYNAKKEKAIHVPIV